MDLDPYEWVILHKEGRKHTNADAMSRISVDLSKPRDALTKTVAIQTEELTDISRTGVVSGICRLDSHTSLQPLSCLTPGGNDDANIESTVNPLQVSLRSEGKYISQS